VTSKVDRGSKFAMLPAAIIESGLDDTCVRIYAYCDLIQGKDGWDASGAQKIADVLSMQASTVMVHARHLEDHGILRVKKDGGRKYTLAVVHNPARKRFGLDVNLPSPELRYKKPSKIPTDGFEPKKTPRSTGGITLAKQRSNEPNCPVGDGGRSRSTRYEVRYGEENELENDPDGHGESVLITGANGHASRVWSKARLAELPRCNQCGRPDERAARLDWNGHYCDCPF